MFVITNRGNNMQKFDFTIPPKKVKWFLKPVINLLVYPSMWKYKPEITYINTENIKAPFLLLCNHNAFLDFKVSEYVLKKNEANYVVAIDGYCVFAKENLQWISH